MIKQEGYVSYSKICLFQAGQATLVKEHNLLRSKVARGLETRGSAGAQPQGNNIREMRWDFIGCWFRQSKCWQVQLLRQQPRQSNWSLHTGCLGWLLCCWLWRVFLLPGWHAQTSKKKSYLFYHWHKCVFLFVPKCILLWLILLHPTVPCLQLRKWSQHEGSQDVCSGHPSCDFCLQEELICWTLRLIDTGFWNWHKLELQ